MTSLLSYPSSVKTLIGDIPNVLVGISDKVTNYTISHTRLSDLSLSKASINSKDVNASLLYDSTTGNTYIQAEDTAFTGPLTDIRTVVLYLNDDAGTLLAHAKLSPSRSVPATGSLDLSFTNDQVFSIRLGTVTKEADATDNAVDVSLQDDPVTVEGLPAGIAENTTLSQETISAYAAWTYYPEHVRLALAQPAVIAGYNASLPTTDKHTYNYKGYGENEAIAGGSLDGYDPLDAPEQTVGTFLTPSDDTFEVEATFGSFLAEDNT